MPSHIHTPSTVITLQDVPGLTWTGISHKDEPQLHAVLDNGTEIRVVDNEFLSIWAITDGRRLPFNLAETGMGEEFEELVREAVAGFSTEPATAMAYDGEVSTGADPDEKDPVERIDIVATVYARRSLINDIVAADGDNGYGAGSDLLQAETIHGSAVGSWTIRGRTPLDRASADAGLVAAGSEPGFFSDDGI